MAKDFTGVDPKILDKAKARLKKLTEGWPAQGGICCGTAVDLTGKEIPYLYAHGGCHSWVTQAFKNHCGGITPKYYNQGCTNFLTLTCHSKKKSHASDAATDGIILWLAKESKFSKFIVNRDDEESLTRDGAIILCGPDGATQAEAMWICKVLRYSTEGSKSLDTWLTLKEGGVDPMLALRICNDIQPIQGAAFGAVTVTQHLSVFGNDYDHRTEPDLKALSSCEVNRESTTTGGLFSRADSPGRGYYTATFKGFCKPFAKDDGWGGKIEGEGVSKEELIYHALNWQKKVLGELVEKDAAPPAKKRLPTRETVFLEVDI